MYWRESFTGGETEEKFKNEKNYLLFYFILTMKPRRIDVEIITTVRKIRLRTRLRREMEIFL